MPVQLNPLPRLCQLADFPLDEIPFQRADVLDVKLPVQVIDFMLQGARQQIFTRHFKPLAFDILGAHRGAFRSRDLFAKTGNT